MKMVKHEEETADWKRVEVLDNAHSALRSARFAFVACHLCINTIPAHNSLIARNTSLHFFAAIPAPLHCDLGGASTGREHR